MSIHIRELFGATPTVSYEFFPPRDADGLVALRATVDALSGTSPAFVSVTCGAGGTSHEHTRDIVVELEAAYPFPAMAHLTCTGFTRHEVDDLLADYAAHGVHNILALAGDPPADGSAPRGEFRYALELVETVRDRGGFSIGVAAHPEVHPRSAGRATDRSHLAAKLAAADFAVTQFFFDPAVYFTLVDELAALGVDKPVIPGVFPVTAPQTVRRFASMNGAAIDDALFARIEAAAPQDRREIAVDHAVSLVQRLLDGGAPGVHLYTMNRPEVAAAIVARLA